jgi:methyl-accepting chemotaxis protein
MNLSLKKQLTTMAVIATLSVLILGYCAYLMAKKGSIGSEQYQSIAYANELTADILPPPLFLVEMMMKVEALPLTENKDESAQLVSEIKQHMKDYEVRKDRWIGSNDVPVAIKQFIVTDLDIPSQQFINYVNSKIIPLTEKNESESYVVALKEAKNKYLDHKKEIDKLVVLANNLAKEQADKGRSLVSLLGTILSVVGLVAILLVVATSLIFSKQILSKLGGDPSELQIITSAITAGDYSAKIDSSISEQSVLGAMRSMLISLIHARDTAVENARIRSALDSASTNVMIADSDRNIIYMNKSVEKMVYAAEGEFRKSLPHFSAGKIINTKIDMFHQDSNHPSQMIDRLTTTHTTQTQFGCCHFRLMTSPIYDQNDNRLGTVLEWMDRTQEINAEQEVTQLVERAASGDFTGKINIEGKTGFFLKIAENLNALVNNAEKGLNDIAGVLGAMSKGDLTAKITADYAGTFGKLKQYSNQTTENLTAMMSDIRNAAEMIFTASSEIAQGNADLSSRTEQQAANLEETASSMEELTSTVKLNADNAKQANVLAEKASTVAVDGGSLIQQVVVTMNDINQSAQKISDIIGVIDGIAFQTNILALNAAVEAARAGDQGRGFAVVASEVRTLAQRSANAAKDIKALINDSVQKIESGNSLVNKSGETMKEIVGSIKRVNDIMSEIAAASNEQSSGIEEVSTAVSQMDEMTQQNAALVEQAAAAAESLQSQADQLSQSVAQFKLSNDQQVRSTATRLTAPPKESRQAVSSTKSPKKLAPPKSSAQVRNVVMMQ